MNRADSINKVDCQDPSQRITRLSGTRDGNGNRWSCTQEECVDYMESGTQFYVEQPAGHCVLLEVETSAHGQKYVKTKTDRQPQDNLLALPECL